MHHIVISLSCHIHISVFLNIFSTSKYFSVFLSIIQYNFFAEDTIMHHIVIRC